MKKFCLCLALLGVLLTLPGAVTGLFAAPPAGDAVVIIVNKANATGNLSADEVRKLFMGSKARWDGSKKVNVAMLAAGAAERQSILKLVYKMSEAEYNKFTLQAVFTGMMAAAPTDLPSAATMKKFVASNPGAIGYVRKADADDSVKVVAEID